MIKSPMSRLAKFPQIKAHSWFNSFNWEALINFDMPVPFKPKGKDDINDATSYPYVNHVLKMKKFRPPREKKVSTAIQKEYDSWFKNF